VFSRSNNPRCGCPILSRSERVGSKVLQESRFGGFFTPPFSKRRKRMGHPLSSLVELNRKRVGHPAASAVPNVLDAYVQSLFREILDVCTGHRRIEEGLAVYFLGDKS